MCTIKEITIATINIISIAVGTGILCTIFDTITENKKIKKAIPINLKSVYRLYSENAYLVNKQYKGKYVKITGRVFFVDKNGQYIKIGRRSYCYDTMEIPKVSNIQKIINKCNNNYNLQLQCLSCYLNCESELNKNYDEFKKATTVECTVRIDRIIDNNIIFDKCAYIRKKEEK